MERDYYARKVANTVGAMLAYWDKNQICRFANEAYLQWFGKTQDELIDRMTLMQLLGPLYEKSRPYIEGAYAGQQQIFGRDVPTHDGKVRHALATFTPDIADGVVQGIIVHVADVSLMKQLEVALQEKTQELTDALELVRHDLSVAKKVQLSTLSKLDEFRNVVDLHCVYQPLNEVGGDIFAVNLVRPNLLRIFLADATGHGVQAALVTMTILTLYESFKNWDVAPDTILMALNNTFISSYSSLNTYFTAGVLDIDLENRQFRYAGGGHPYPLTISEDGSAHTWTTKGALMGLRQSDSGTRIEGTLLPNMSLYLFTDGAFEEFNVDGDEFGRDRMERIFVEKRTEGFQKISDSLLHELNEFRNGTSPNDDLTLICLKLL